jgi:cyclohexa-1,5-dienecarbonyl-CoA hydratase
MVVASERSRIGQPEIAVGVYPPVAAAWFPKIIGLKKTYELLLTGKALTAKEAEAIGLVNAVFPTEGFRDGVAKFVGELMNKSRPVAMWTKRAIKAGLSLDFPQALKASEIMYLHGCMATKDAKEGISAFMEKRKAVWKDE